MSDELYANLSWLPAAPLDFRLRCRAIDAESRDAAAALAALARFSLGHVQLSRLAEAVERVRTRADVRNAFVPFKLGIVGNATLDALPATLVATALRHGILLECVVANFGQTIQEALSPHSQVNRSKPDAVLLALDHRGVPLSAEGDTGDEAVAFVGALRDGFREYAGAPCIVATLAAPPEQLFGSIDRAIAGTARFATASFNARLAATLGGTSDVMLDVAAIAETVGLANWHSPEQWNAAKLPFDVKFLPLYAEHVARVIAAMRGKSRKCLILDLDNTVWGGIIGDDGVEGIVIGQGNATGEAYLDVQRMALALRERGIVLAVASKNTDETARVPFASHPEMLLREDHIAVFQANWSDKATNIRAIAAELALGVDAMVFLDDNPVERGLIRAELPDVAVPELPADPASYARTLAAAGYFEAVAYSDEDRNRARAYQDNARRVALRAQTTDLEGYLASLEMEIVFRPFDATNRSRIAQLVNKSNQFNLTTHRYTELEIGAMENDATLFTLQVCLVDRFGDNGMIGVVICRPEADAQWTIDTWLMSCRVLGRRVEEMVLHELLHHGRLHGIERLVGVYRPTAKNEMVRGHYERLGFTPVSSDGDETRWALHVASADVVAAPMIVTRTGFELTAPATP